MNERNKLASGVGAVSLKGKVALQGWSALFTDVTMMLDDQTATGRLAVNPGETEKRIVEGTLAFETLDLEPFAPNFFSADALNLVRSFAKPDQDIAVIGESDLTHLAQSNIDLRLSASQVVFGDLSFQDAAGTVQLGTTPLV